MSNPTAIPNAAPAAKPNHNETFWMSRGANPETAQFVKYLEGEPVEWTDLHDVTGMPAEKVRALTWGELRALPVAKECPTSPAVWLASPAAN